MINKLMAETIRKNVIELIRVHKINRAELARRMKCDQSYITSLLKENKKPGRLGFGDKTINKLCLAFGIDKEVLLEGYPYNTSGLFTEEAASPSIEIVSETKEEDIETKLLRLVNNVLRNGTAEQIDVLCSIAETISMNVDKQKKAAPMIKSLESEGRKVA